MPERPDAASGEVTAAAAGDHRLLDEARAGEPAPVAWSHVRADLGRVLEEAAGYRVRHPAEAAEGHWWDAAADLRPVRDVPAPRSWREAAVLILFHPGPAAASGGAAATTPHVLLTERSATLATHPSQVAFPGGSRDAADADAVATALREAEEEVALDPRSVHVLGELPPTPIPVSGFMVTPVLAVAEELGQLVPEAGEVERVLSVSVEALRVPRNRFTTVVPGGRKTFRAPAFFVEDTLIWGFTAILLDRLLKRLGWGLPWDSRREIDPREYQPL